MSFFGLIGGADRAGEEAAAQWRVRDEPDAELAQQRQDAVLGSRVQSEYSDCGAVMG